MVVSRAKRTPDVLSQTISNVFGKHRGRAGAAAVPGKDRRSRSDESIRMMMRDER